MYTLKQLLTTIVKWNLITTPNFKTRMGRQSNYRNNVLWLLPTVDTDTHQLVCYFMFKKDQCNKHVQPPILFKAISYRFQNNHVIANVEPELITDLDYYQTPTRDQQTHFEIKRDQTFDFNQCALKQLKALTALLTTLQQKYDFKSINALLQKISPTIYTIKLEEFYGESSKTIAFTTTHTTKCVNIIDFFNRYIVLNKKPQETYQYEPDLKTAILQKTTNSILSQNNTKRYYGYYVHESAMVYLENVPKPVSKINLKYASKKQVKLALDLYHNTYNKAYWFTQSEREHLEDLAAHPDKNYCQKDIAKLIDNHVGTDYNGMTIKQFDALHTYAHKNETDIARLTKAKATQCISHSINRQ